MLYIDITTGTYGDADSIRFVHGSAALEDMSDSEICAYGEDVGLTLEEVEVILK